MPRQIREDGPWGDFLLKVRFVASPEGKVKDARIEESSGDSQLDAYVLEAIRSLELMRFTKDMGQEDLAFTLPINISNPPPAEPAVSD
ncbi:TonB family protein [Paracoccus caeni]|uniref:TonB family protein n=1 Tax=Paracoccus caeni TaxID=657651 RepID=A0A934W139_9RHOB|nr:TonB family protein [Paracoccus caeni]MBK4217590.1 TonB family protein [Paracoccus caeni]